MKSQFKGFIIGFVFACMLFVPATALADSIQAYFNTASITINGRSAVSQGENYTLSNGSAVPFSINYKGTTYLPIRKVSELLGINVNYDNASKTIQIATNSNNVVVQEKPAEFKTTNAAVTYTTAYSVFNECTKAANNDGQKVTHIVGFKDGSKIDTNIDYSYYKDISSKLNSVQLWKATVDNKNNITKVKTTSASKTGKVESSGGRDYVTLSTGTYNFENNLVAYRWTDDDEYKVYNGSIKQGDIVNLYDTDGNRKYDVVIFTRDYKGKAVIEGDTTTNTENEKVDNTAKETEQPKNTDNAKEKTTPKVSTKGFAVIFECTKAANNDDDKVQHIVGFKDGRKMDTFTTEQNIVRDWSEPKENSDGFSNAALYEIGLSSIDVIVSADKVSADVGQGKAETANGRDSVVIGGKTYSLSSHVIFYQVRDDEYKLYSGDLKDNDMVQLYETDSSKSGYDIVIFSRPKN